MRAVAAAGSFGTESAWAGSVPTYLVFERGVTSEHGDLRSGVRVLHFPYEQLERWREWELARAEAPLGLLAGSRALYDPTGHFGRIQRQLWNLSEELRAEWRAETLRTVAEELSAMKRTFQGSGSGAAEQITALGEARRWATEALYPALLTHAGSRWDAPLEGPVWGDAVLPGPQQADLRRLPTAPPTDAAQEPREAPGSNNFAVAGALTADGRAIVANDMHLSLRVPNIWFRARLRYPDPAAPNATVDVQGVTLPGLPRDEAERLRALLAERGIDLMAAL